MESGRIKGKLREWEGDVSCVFNTWTCTKARPWCLWGSATDVSGIDPGYTIGEIITSFECLDKWRASFKVQNLIFKLGNKKQLRLTFFLIKKQLETSFFFQVTPSACNCHILHIGRRTRIRCGSNWQGCSQSVSPFDRRVGFAWVFVAQPPEYWRVLLGRNPLILTIGRRAQALPILLQVHSRPDALFKPCLAGMTLAESQPLFVHAFSGRLATPFSSAQFVGIHDVEPFGKPNDEVRTFLLAGNRGTDSVPCF